MTSRFVPSGSTPPLRLLAACRTCPMLWCPRRCVLPSHGWRLSAQFLLEKRSGPLRSSFDTGIKCGELLLSGSDEQSRQVPRVDHSGTRQAHSPPGFARIPLASRHGTRRSEDHSVAWQRVEGRRSSVRPHRHSRLRADSPRRYGSSPREDSQDRRAPSALAAWSALPWSSGVGFSSTRQHSATRAFL